MGKTRGMAEVEKKHQATKTESIAAETVAYGQKLLRDFATFVANNRLELSPEEMIEYLQELIAGEIFETANIEYRGDITPDSRFDPLADQMSAISGEYLSDTAYNVWFTRKDGNWILAFNKIGSEGNYRSER
jgi:hypothetical protein